MSTAPSQHSGPSRRRLINPTIIRTPKTDCSFRISSLRLSSSSSRTSSCSVQNRNIPWIHRIRRTTSDVQTKNALPSSQPSLSVQNEVHFRADRSTLSDRLRQRPCSASSPFCPATRLPSADDKCPTLSSPNRIEANPSFSERSG